MYQVMSAVLMLICVFPLVISRIADIKSNPPA
jgi:hypothetical protein